MLHLARRVEKPCHFYTLGGDIIKSVSEATYLGVTISNNFGSRSSHWYAHISSAVASTSQRLGFLHRNLRGSPYRMRELAFEALVRSTLNYCGSIWDPSVQGEIQKLEMIQNWGGGGGGQDGFGVHVVSFLSLHFWETWAGLAWWTDVVINDFVYFINFWTKLLTWTLMNWISSY